MNVGRRRGLPNLLCTVFAVVPLFPLIAAYLHDTVRIYLQDGRMCITVINIVKLSVKKISLSFIEFVNNIYHSFATQPIPTKHCLPQHIT